MPTSEPRYHPIGMLAMIAPMIDGYVEDAARLLPDLRQVRERPHVFDDATVNRVIAVYGETVAMLPVFEEQVRRWGESTLTPPQRTEVVRLFEQLARLRPMVTEVLALAEEIRSGTIERVMSKSDLELGLEVLTGKRRRP